MSNQTNINTSEESQATAAIALGSNLGESIATVENALQTISETTGISLTKNSSWYKTKPVGGPPQPDYVNGCALVKTKLDPHQLLETILGIEQQFGRVRKEHWGARTLDLDLILYNDIVLDTPNLQVPHPRMRERAFVLIPLAEIAPNWIEPVTGKTITQLRDEIDCSGVVQVETEKQC